jgi:predicted amidophosphoribosyltransferase
MVKINPRKIEGPWQEGYALDQHSLKSEYIGDNEFGHPQFETTRSEIGDLLFKLKYRNDQSAINELAKAAATYLAKWKPDVDLLLPVTPSKVRAKQPVFLVGEEIAKRMNIPFSNEFVTRREALPELKNISRDERLRLLKGAHGVQKDKVKGRKILLFDDLFQSGSTMSAITSALLDANVKKVFALTLTRTQS